MWFGMTTDASVRIEAWDRAALERLLRYCARPPFANDRLEWDDPAQQTVLYHLPKPAPDGRLVLKLQPLELIDKLVALIPPPRRHRHRYHGVLAPNAPWREQITAEAEAEANDQDHPDDSLKQAEGGKAPSDTPDHAQPKSFDRPRSCYLWAALLARIFEILPLSCPCYITDYVWGSSTPKYPSDYVPTTPAGRTVI
jgi:hypothetical protein